MKKFLFFLLGLILGMAIIWGILILMQNKNETEEKGIDSVQIDFVKEAESPKNETTLNEDITVTKPLANAEISSPLLVEGSAKGTWFFEASASVKVVDDKGIEIGNGSLQAVGDWMTENFVPFKGQISFDKTTSQNGFLIFEKSNPSGLKENAEEFKLPVNFKDGNPQTAQTVKVFFSNSKKDPEMLNCEKVYSVERKIDTTTSVAQKALEELLKGPTAAEKTNGYVTAINTGVKINKISILNGIAYVDFTEMLQQGVGGSCKTSTIIAQIKETLKQFSSVKEVKISIDGESEAILQP